VAASCVVTLTVTDEEGLSSSATLTYRVIAVDSGAECAGVCSASSECTVDFPVYNATNEAGNAACAARDGGATPFCCLPQ